MFLSRILISDGLFDLTCSYVSKKNFEKSNLTSSIESLLQQANPFKNVAVFNSKGQLLPKVSHWLSMCFKNEVLATTTIKNYGRSFSYLIDYLNEHDLFKDYSNDDALMYIEEHHFKEYFVYLENEENLSLSTIRNREGAYSNFFNSYLSKKKSRPLQYREDSPFSSGCLSKKGKNKLIELIKIDELIGILNLLARESERAVIQFMFDSGLRVSEIPRITKADIDDALAYESGTIIDDDTFCEGTVYKPFYVMGSKGRRNEIKPRYTYVSVSTLHRVKRYISSPIYRKHFKQNQSNNPIFLNSRGKPWTTASLKKMISRVSKKALLQGIIKKNLHPHKLRHSFAVGFLNSNDLGTDAAHRLLILMTAMGHEFLDTTKVYTTIPADIYCHYLDEHGSALHRNDLMQITWDKTKMNLFKKFGK
ncbi:tyrosine-type recombinase/integrase [Pseudoalteromonas sp. CH_XMU1449-3]|uniref:tyrosine-type recombinase/integrase n=1 Tax=Pseudoalteromonas sp. CH_XMU1449-3 TaxID=3107774 RepID=UPI0030096B3E